MLSHTIQCLTHSYFLKSHWKHIDEHCDGDGTATAAWNPLLTARSPTSCQDAATGSQYKMEVKRMLWLASRPPVHYGFSYHFSGNGTYFFQINIAASIFIENFWNIFYMIDNSQKIMPNICLIKYDRYLQRYLQKTWRGRQVTLKFCVSTK